MYFKYKDMKIYYEKTKTKKQNIIILPGWGDTRKTFTNIIESLKENNTIYILDYPSFGNSNKLTKIKTIYDYKELIINFIKELDIENPIIIAHSFGGRITSLISNEINIKKIILIDVAGIKRINIKTKIKILTYKLLKLLTNLFPKNKEKLRKKLLNKFSSSDYKELDQIMKQTFKNIIKINLKNNYKNIKQETLILWGEKDIDTPLKDAYKLNNIIKNSALIIFKNSSHYSYLENEYQTIKILQSFINI